MEAGRELDKLIAEKVMGLKVVTTQEETSQFDPGARFVPGADYWEVDVDWALPPGIDEESGDFDDHFLLEYSTVMGGAWQVVERLMTLGIFVERIQYLAPTMWRCILERNPHDPGTRQRHYQQVAGTAPHAICLAALEAVNDRAPTL